MEPIISAVSDGIASHGYLLAFLVFSTWAGIALNNAWCSRRWALWTALAVGAMMGATSFLLMGIYTGWRSLSYPFTLQITRITFALMAVSGLVFTGLFLYDIGLRSRRRRHADNQRVDRGNLQP